MHKQACLLLVFILLMLPVSGLTASDPETKDSLQISSFELKDTETTKQAEQNPKTENAISEAELQQDSTETPILRFLALSDLHLDDLLYQTSNSNATQYQMLLDFVNGKGYDLFVCGGDISSYGVTSYWQSAKDQLEERTDISQSLWALGNHEYGTLALSDAAAVQTKWKAFTGRSSIYFHTEVKGYHFLLLAAEKGTLGTYGNLSAEQVSWFAGELAAAAEASEGKPIFVISHFALTNGDMATKIALELAKYDNIFFLWGHEHGSKDTALSDIMALPGQYTHCKMGQLHHYDTADADGLTVEVYADRVVLRMDRVDGDALDPNSATAINRYTVVFLAEDGTQLKSEKITHGQAAQAPETESREGYEAEWGGDPSRITAKSTFQLHYQLIWTLGTVGQADGQTTAKVYIPAQEGGATALLSFYDASDRYLGSTTKVLPAGEGFDGTISAPLTSTSVKLLLLNGETCPLYPALDKETKAAS